MTWRKREIMNMAREAGDATTDARGRQTQGEKHMNPLTMTDKELIEHASKQVQALRMALDMIECEKYERRHVRWAIIDALKEEAAAQPASVQKRPQNCGTGYCSCIECVMEPAPVQEPVAWMSNESAHRLKHGGSSKGAVPVHAKQSNTSKIPLYATPPQRKPLVFGLNDDGQFTFSVGVQTFTLDYFPENDEETEFMKRQLTHAIEAAHGIKGEA